MNVLGVGILYNGALARFFETHPRSVDFVSVVPERLWTARGQRYVPLPAEVAAIDVLAERYPLIAHGVGLSIAAASGFDVPHLEQVAHWRGRFDFRWIGEHLSAVHGGVAIPLAWDEDLLALLIERVQLMQRMLDCRVILENGVVHTPVSDCDMGEAELMNRLCAVTGCGVLLDLHNLYTNEVNLGIDAGAFLDQLELAHVQEIHIAGGSELCGIYLDSHAGAVPDEVWQLLDRALPRCPRLRAITFEFHESYHSTMGDDGIAVQLESARGLWQHHRSKCA